MRALRERLANGEHEWSERSERRVLTPTCACLERCLVPEERPDGVFGRWGDFMGCGDRMGRVDPMECSDPIGGGDPMDGDDPMRCADPVGCGDRMDCAILGVAATP